MPIHVKFKFIFLKKNLLKALDKFLYFPLLKIKLQYLYSIAFHEEKLAGISLYKYYICTHTHIYQLNREMRVWGLGKLEGGKGKGLMIYFNFKKKEQ